MVWPLVIGGTLIAGGTLASTLGQRKMSADKRKQLEAIIAKLEREWATPEFDETPITLEEYKVLEEFTPEIAPLVQERYPKLVTEKGSTQAIKAQKDALDRLQRYAVTGDDAIAAASRERALTDAQAREASMRQTALSRLQQAGLGTPEARIAAELGAASQSVSGAREQMLAARAEQEGRRQQAIRDAANLAGQMRGQEFQREKSAADVINEFNQRATARRQAHLTDAAQQRNQARMANIQQRQQTANLNIQQRNALKQAMQQRADMIAREKAQSKNQLLAATTGLEGQKPVDTPWWYTAGQVSTALGQPIAAHGLSELAGAGGETTSTTTPSKGGQNLSLGGNPYAGAGGGNASTATPSTGGVGSDQWEDRLDGRIF